MNRRVLFAIPLAVLVACSGTETTAPLVDQPPLSPVISDGANGGNPDFFFLPPLAPNPSGPLFNAGAFNPNLAPDVEICALDLAVGSDPIQATPCKAGGYTASLTPVVSVPDEHYKSNWTVPVSSVDAYYRIRVIVGGTLLGFVDVHSVNSGKDLKNAKTGEVVPRQDGSTLPIKFRIEQFALCGDGPCVSATVDPGTGGTVLFGGTPGLPLGGVTIPAQPGGGAPITLTIQLCPGENPFGDLVVFGSCFNINATTGGEAEVDLSEAATVFICDVLAATAGLDPELRKRIHLHRRPTEGDITVLPNDGAPFCNLPGDEGASTVGGMLRALVHGEWKMAGKQIVGMLAPKPLYASRRLNLGAGGKTCCFSDFQFAEETPAEETPSVLIFGPSMSAPTVVRPDNEQTLAVVAGYTVTVASAATWASMTSAQFASYKAIVFGDPTCTGSAGTTLSTANANKAVWSAVATGPAVVIGTDPQYHSYNGAPSAPAAKLLITNGINYAASGAATGLYVSLSCYYAGVPSLTPTQVEFLSVVGDFQVRGQSGLDANTVTTTAVHPVLSGLTSALLSNWDISVHDAFATMSSFPETFSTIATVAVTGGGQLPYIIVR